jgi:hypothetical protein
MPGEAAAQPTAPLFFAPSLVVPRSTHFIERV